MVFVFIEHVDGAGVCGSYLLLGVGGANAKVVRQRTLRSIGQDGRGQITRLRSAVLECENFYALPI